MWPFPKNSRHDKYLADPVVSEAAENWFGSARSFARFLLRFSDAQAARVIEAYRRQEAGARYDPLEDDPEYAELIGKVDAELKREYPVRRRGQCHRIWRKKRAMLKREGVDWISPPQMNPYNRYD